MQNLHLAWQWYAALFLMTSVSFGLDRVLDVYFFKLTSLRHTALFNQKKWVFLASLVCTGITATLLISIMNRNFIIGGIALLMLLLAHFWAMKHSAFSGFKEISSSAIFTLGVSLGPLTHTTSTQIMIPFMLFLTVLVNVITQAYFDAPTDQFRNESALIKRLSHPQIKYLLILLISGTLLFLFLNPMPLPLFLSLLSILLLHLATIIRCHTNQWSDTLRLILEISFLLPGILTLISIFYYLWS